MLGLAIFYKTKFRQFNNLRFFLNLQMQTEFTKPNKLHANNNDDKIGIDQVPVSKKGMKTEGERIFAFSQD